MDELDPKKTENPFLAARKKWDLHVGDALAGRLLWQAVAILSLVTMVTTVAWAAQRDLQPKLLPYIVEVDELGNAEALRIAESLKAASTRNFEVALTEFVTLARRVTTDATLQTAAVNGAMAKLNPEDPSFTKYLETYRPAEDPPNPNFPFERAKSETVRTTIHSVLQQSEGSWEVEWEETVYDRDGHTKEVFMMRGLFQVYQAIERLTDEEAIRDNPLGIYIKDYDWGRIEKREVHQ